jgi:hypothetical protein
MSPHSGIELVLKGFGFVLKGRGFSRAASVVKTTAALAAEGRQIRKMIFRSLLIRTL